MTIITTIVPIISVLLTEQRVLSDRRVISSALHDELQVYLWENSRKIPDTFKKEINKKEATFHFTHESDFVKGCVNWENGKQNKETFCVYGLPQE